MMLIVGPASNFSKFFEIFFNFNLFTKVSGFRLPRPKFPIFETQLLKNYGWEAKRNAPYRQRKAYFQRLEIHCISFEKIL